MTLKNIRKRIRLLENIEEPVKQVVLEIYKFYTGHELNSEAIYGYLNLLKKQEKELTPPDPVQKELFYDHK